MTKLIPCPYCGNPNVKLLQTANDYFYIHCDNYYCSRRSTMFYPNKERCIKDWNARYIYENGTFD